MRFQGAQVVICGRNEQTLQEVAAELDVFGTKAAVSLEEDVDHLFDFAFEKLGGLDVLINNAGVGFMGSLTETRT